MATTDFPDFDGVRRALQNPLPPGQALMAASRPVAIASDQSAIPVFGTVNVSGTIPVNGTFWQTTQPVSIAALPALAAGTALIGKVGLDQSTPGTTNAFSLSYLGSSAVAIGNGVVGAGVQRVAIASDNSAIPANVSQFGGNAASLGAGTVGAGTLRITQASDSPEIAALGAPADAAWASGNGTHTAILKTIANGILSTADTGVEIHQPADVINFIPVLDTAAYTAGDVLSATAAILNVMRVNDGRANLFSLTGIDKSKQKPAMTMLFYQTNVTSAAANAANALSDADQINLLGFHRILATDWIDYANNSICCFKGPTSPGILLEAATGTKDVYVVCILDAGTPTFAVGDLMFKLGVVQS
jgi:hypothetical protein